MRNTYFFKGALLVSSSVFRECLRSSYRFPIHFRGGNRKTVTQTLTKVRDMRLHLFYEYNLYLPNYRYKKHARFFFHAGLCFQNRENFPCRFHLHRRTLLLLVWRYGFLRVQILQPAVGEECQRSLKKAGKNGPVYEHVLP